MWEQRPGAFNICPVCFWEDDPAQSIYPDLEYGANAVTLNEAKQNFKAFRVSDKKFITFVREPREEEKSKTDTPD